MTRPQIIDHPFDKACEAPHLDAVGTDKRRRALLAPATVEILAETFRVLGDPTRVRILDALADGELCVCDIASLVRMSESACASAVSGITNRFYAPRRAGP